jgi:hypothetical protein
MADAPTAVDIARRLADGFELEQIPYAVGGALALGFYAAPRATVDVDINVFVSPRTGLRRVLAVLNELGFRPDAPDTIATTAIEDGQFRGRVAGVRVDVFVPAIAFYADMAARTRRAILLGRPIEILGPEDLLTLKMMFFRRKDLADVEAVLRFPPVPFDASAVRRNLVDMVGADDERVHEWDTIVSDTSTDSRS